MLLYIAQSAAEVVKSDSDCWRVSHLGAIPPGWGAVRGATDSSSSPVARAFSIIMPSCHWFTKNVASKDTALGMIIHDHLMVDVYMI